MKNLLIYYFQIALPIPLMVWAAISHQSRLFATLLFLYLIYRWYIDYNKLYKSGVAKKHEWYNPFLNIKYFKELYFQ
jgi:hypothetical protein